MLTLAETRALLDDKDMSDEEIREIRDVCDGLASLALEVFREKSRKGLIDNKLLKNESIQKNTQQIT